MIKTVTYTKVNANGNTQEKTFQWNNEFTLENVIKSIFNTTPVYAGVNILIAVVGDAKDQTIIIDKNQSAIRY